MQFSEIVQEAKNEIKDSAYDLLVPGYVNEAFLQASGKINIPDLKRIGVASTIPGLNYVSLAGISDGFSGRLSKIITEDIVRCDNLEEMLEYITDNSREISEVGSVEFVALEGKTLWYFPSPSTAQSISCVLFTNPLLLESDDDIPEAFPEICHRNIGVHGAAYLAYGQIEDGIEGEKVNTAYHLQMYNAGVQQLMEWVGRHRVHKSVSTLNDTVSTQTR